MIYHGKTECPFVTSPFSDCYVTSMSSQDIESMIYYCGENYEECDIYKKHRSGVPLSGAEREGHTRESTRHLPRFLSDFGNGTADLP